MTEPTEALRRLRAGGKPALARALAAVEADALSLATLDLLDAAWAEPRGRVVGLTGPPGVGKSTLIGALVAAWRSTGLTVGVLAVDPSSRRSGGALLGDRTRLDLDPGDDGVFVRSMAARGRLGGVAEATAAAAALMRALHDIVLVETVGVGQSETEIADLADTVVLAVQPGSGDSLQYLKAGIVEIPDIAVVTKADLGALAARARRDLESSLRLQTGTEAGWRTPVMALSSTTGDGIAELVGAIAAHAAWLDDRGRLARRRADQATHWLRRAVLAEFGRHGLDRIAGRLNGDTGSPFRRLAAVTRFLAA
jgi:LAO/AO transport system kinase